MANRAKPCQSNSPAASMHPAYYQLHALLQTVRALSRHEDEICTLLAEMERTKKMPAGVRRELADLLSELPVRSLQSELVSLSRALEQAA